MSVCNHRQRTRIIDRNLINSPSSNEFLETSSLAEKSLDVSRTFEKADLKRPSHKAGALQEAQAQRPTFKIFKRGIALIV
jgi:hypothetical protein